MDDFNEVAPRLMQKLNIAAIAVVFSYMKELGGQRQE